MKTYTFNYTSQRIIWLVLAIAVASYIGFLFVLVKHTRVDPLFQILLPPLLAAAIVILNKTNIRKKGSADLYEDHLELDLNGHTQTIEFKELESYKTYIGRKGATLQLEFKNGRSLKITANNTFCNTAAIETFFIAAKKMIERFGVHEPAD